MMGKCSYELGGVSQVGAIRDRWTEIHLCSLPWGVGMFKLLFFSSKQQTHLNNDDDLLKRLTC